MASQLPPLVKITDYLNEAQVNALVKLGWDTLRNMTVAESIEWAKKNVPDTPPGDCVYGCDGDKHFCGRYEKVPA